jgi:hypothetical protein
MGTVRAEATAVMVATTLGGLLLSAHLLTAPSASADCSATIAKAEASEAQDAASSSHSHTGTCWQNPGANW